MKFPRTYTLKEVADIFTLEYAGDPEHPVTGINEIHRVETGDITFVDVEKYFKKALGSAATTVIINQKITPPEGKGLLFSEDPFTTYNNITTYFQPSNTLNTTVDHKWDDSVLVGNNVNFGYNVKLGKNVQIGHNVSIGSDVTIGDNTMIFPNVTIYDHTEIGANVRIHAGTVIGGDAFYYKARPERRDQMISVGKVIIEDHAHIGANCTIDRGVSAITMIGAHTKIDNLVQVGHDTLIGKHCVIASQVGIAGCVTVEDRVTLWGQVGLASDMKVGEGAVLLAKTGAMSDLEGGKTYGGMIADDGRSFIKKEAALRKLPDFLRNAEQSKKD